VVGPSQVLLSSQTKTLLEDYLKGEPLPSGIIPSNSEMHRVKGLIEEKRESTWLGMSMEPILFEIQKEKDVKQSKMPLKGNKIISIIYMSLLFSLCFCNSTKNSAVCRGLIDVFESALVDKRQTRSS
jgi:hypothetical protein